MASGFGKGVRVGPEVLQPLISTTPCQVRLAHIAADLPWEHNSCCSPHLPPSRHRQRHSGICSQMLLLTECALTGAGLISLAPVTDTSMSSQGAVKKTGLKPISLQPVPAVCVDKTFDNIVERSYQCWAGLSQRCSSLTTGRWEGVTSTRRCLQHPKDIPYK